MNEAKYTTGDLGLFMSIFEHRKNLGEAWPLNKEQGLTLLSVLIVLSFLATLIGGHAGESANPMDSLKKKQKTEIFTQLDRLLLFKNYFIAGFSEYRLWKSNLAHA